MRAMSDAAPPSLTLLPLKGGGDAVRRDWRLGTIVFARPARTLSPSPLEGEARPVRSLFAIEPGGANREERLAGSWEGEFAHE